MTGLATESAIFELWALADHSASGPLRGVRILDLTTVVMGPSATQILGDLGADVVKVETLGGDNMRWNRAMAARGHGAALSPGNRNKRSVVLNLKSGARQGGHAGAGARADVLVTNVRPQGLQRLGLDYEAVCATNPASSIAQRSATARAVRILARPCMTT